MTNCHYIPVLTPKECEIYLKKIYSLKCSWIKRSANLPFYTLGLVAYLDGPTGEYNNLGKRNKYNNLLTNNFSDLHKKVTASLSCILKTPCEIYNNSAIPGFHIYINNENLGDARAVHQNTPHTDIQFKYVFPEKGLKQEDFVSFTLCLSCGPDSGLNLWEPNIPLPENVLDFVTESSMISIHSQDPLSKYATQSIFEKPSMFIPYCAGKMVVHHGVFYHHPVLKATKIPRITLQGHGVKKDGKFLLFW